MKRFRQSATFLWFVLIASGSASGQLNQASLRPEKLRAIDRSINEAISEHECPGGVLWLEHRDSIYHKAYGNRALIPDRELMSEDTIFDLASLTKVIACTPAIMLLIESGQVGLDATVQTYIPEFRGEGREAITVRHLLTHFSGLRPGIDAKSNWHGRDEALSKACAEKPRNPPGETFRYSDIDFILLGEIVRRVSKMPLDEFVTRKIFKPLKMTDTGFMPPENELPRIAPTEVIDGKPFRGVVHDPTARKMGGVSGHAGLFSTAADLARYARMLLNLGELDGVRILEPETVKLMTSVQTPEACPERRGLGWDIDSSYSGPRGKYFPLGSYGHTGWTGTSIWIDPFSRSFLIFLSNRNHPNENGSVGSLRIELATLAAEAISDFNFAGVPGALHPRKTEEAKVHDPRLDSEHNRQSKVLNGIDVLAKDNFEPLKGKRVGLITNQTGQDRYRNSTIDLLYKAPGVTLKALFSPEHGIRGLFDEKVEDGTDEKTGLRIYSLYGSSRKPSPEQLKECDALVFDIQDVGCRFYTYISTMGLCMEAAAESHLGFFILDRVDPIDAVTLDGPVLNGEMSFVGFHSLPLRYGMTIGELAKMFKVERHCTVDLTVIGMEGWSRSLWLDQTGLPWTNPSPNMRNLNEATLYPGVGLLETALSVGRGTDTPFEAIGAPYIDDLRFAEELNQASLPGVHFVPVQFTPAQSIHKNQLCKGVHIILTDRYACPVVDIALLAAKTLHREHPDQFKVEKMEHLLLHPSTIDAIKQDKPLNEIHALWKKDLDEFKSRRNKYLIYR